MAKKRQIPHTFVIVFFIIMFSAVLTWIIPGGKYEEHKTVKSCVEETEMQFHYVENQPQTWQIFSAMFDGFVNKADIVIFILLIGGAFWIMNESKAIDVGIFAFLRKTGKLEKYKIVRIFGIDNIIITLIMLMFSIFGAVFGMSEETIAFIIILVPMAISMGYDSIVGLCMVFVAAGIGFAGAILNPFTIGIAQGLSGLPLFSGIEYRMFCWLVINVFGIAWVLRYAKKVKKNPKSSIVYEDDAYWRERGKTDIENITYYTPKSAWFAYSMILITLIILSFVYPKTTIKIGNPDSVACQIKSTDVCKISKSLKGITKNDSLKIDAIITMPNIKGTFDTLEIGEIKSIDKINFTLQPNIKFDSLCNSLKKDKSKYNQTLIIKSELGNNLKEMQLPATDIKFVDSIKIELLISKVGDNQISMNIPILKSFQTTNKIEFNIETTPDGSGSSSSLPIIPIAAGIFAILGFFALRKSVHYFILTLLGFTIIFLIVGVMGYGWYVMEIASLFLAMGILSGIATSKNANEITKLFLEGVKDIMSAALIVGLAGGIIAILKNGQIIDTILYGLSQSMKDFGQMATVFVMYVIQTLINLIIPSGSAKAALTMPIMAPFSDLIGLSRQATVMAYQFGDGFTNMITPTSGVLIGVLGVARIPYEKWFKWILPFMIGLFIIGLLLLIPTVTMKLNGF